MSFIKSPVYTDLSYIISFLSFSTYKTMNYLKEGLCLLFILYLDLFILPPPSPPDPHHSTIYSSINAMEQDCSRLKLSTPAKYQDRFWSKKSFKELIQCIY